MEASGELHTLAALPPGKKPGTHFIGGWVGSKVGLDEMSKRKKSSFINIIQFDLNAGKLKKRSLSSRLSGSLV
jgi:hypothetical protein